ncbi:hypothetical protein [Streptomyces sp. BA2]|uniref:hypothetical protein n=1 Tax=Streptomyces sp. BA2 TaxID=436595 RepID=UPI0013237C93|nr:hypothetical protein [Streptomyces sp. BA2]MWA14817.1 hypothetical protein [Streptomyces sp. BA2]
MSEQFEARPGTTGVGAAAANQEFRLRLPNNGPQARGRVLPEKGMNGSLKFLLVRTGPAYGLGEPLGEGGDHVTCRAALRHDSRQPEGLRRKLRRRFPSASRRATSARPPITSSPWIPRSDCRS